MLDTETDFTPRIRATIGSSPKIRTVGRRKSRMASLWGGIGEVNLSGMTAKIDDIVGWRMLSPIPAAE